MKVLIKSERPLVPFRELKSGAVFLTVDSVDPMMVVTCDEESAVYGYNAVDLMTGELRIIGKDVPVVKLHAVLHVNN